MALVRPRKPRVEQLIGGRWGGGGGGIFQVLSLSWPSTKLAQDCRSGYCLCCPLCSIITLLGCVREEQSIKPKQTLRQIKFKFQPPKRKHLVNFFRMVFFFSSLALILMGTNWICLALALEAQPIFRIFKL